MSNINELLDSLMEKINGIEKSTKQAKDLAEKQADAMAEQTARIDDISNLQKEAAQSNELQFAQINESTKSAVTCLEERIDSISQRQSLWNSYAGSAVGMVKSTMSIPLILLHHLISPLIIFLAKVFIFLNLTKKSK